VFWREDFSKHEHGDPLPTWGANVIVRKFETGRFFLGSLVPGEHAVRQAIRFPPNFTLEFDMTLDKGSGMEFPLILIDEKGDELRVDFSYNAWRRETAVTLPGVNRQTVKVSSIQTVKLVKTGTTYKIASSANRVGEL
jgi:hypothetical protein